MGPFLRGFCSELTKVAFVSVPMDKLSEAVGDSRPLASIKPQVMNFTGERKRPEIYQPSPKYVAKPMAPKGPAPKKVKATGAGAAKPKTGGRMPWSGMDNPRQANEKQITAARGVADRAWSAARTSFRVGKNNDTPPAEYSRRMSTFAVPKSVEAPAPKAAQFAKTDGSFAAKLDATRIK